MADQLQHDPRTKQQVKDALYEYLYTPLLKQFKLRLDTLIVKNSVLLGNSERSFSYKGVVYQMESAPLPKLLNRLVRQLHPTMDDYISERDQLNNYELPYVLGFISQVLNASNDLQDLLLVLPSSVHRPIEDLIASCPCRTRKLTQEGVHNLRIRNQVSINLMKQRQVMNLLI